MPVFLADAKSIFIKAIEMDASDGRSRYLDQACQGNSDLRGQVQTLLNAYEEPNSLLDGNGGVATICQPMPQQIGTSIGPYKIREQLGEGGMGVVYAAEQKEPVRRKVALKIIKAGMDTGQVVARFEAERQALALMDHPGIAKVIDAGSTDAGRPYFVMELIVGLPINDYCDQAKMPTRQRLQLFASVCSAVQHAHQKGIIHRDLKPSNVMVTEIDGKPVAKVIDFGVAKATGEQLTEQTIYTNVSQMVGTPLYMSPEQAGLSGIDIDTRSDVYSLGVILYELLSGCTPIDRDQMRQAGYEEIRRIIREDEPQRPSTRFDTLNAANSSTISERRGVDPRRLQQTVHGELDWIVMKTLEKDRNRRYDSATALGQDIQRYLDDEPVLACPPSVGYRLRKFTRRYKGTLVTATTVLLALLVGTGIAVSQAFRAAAAEEVALQERDTAERSLQAAMDAIEQLLVHVGNPELANIPKMQEVRERILNDSLDFYERFKLDSSTSPSVDYRAAKVFLQLGDLATKTKKDSDPVIKAYSSGLDLANALVLRHPKRNDFRELQAELNLGCADYHWMPHSIATDETDARAMRHFEAAQQQYAYLSLTEPGNEDYRERQGFVFARMAFLCRWISPSDPRAIEFDARAIRLGHVNYMRMAEAAETTDPDLAEQYWRKVIAHYESTPTEYLSGSPGSWWAIRASRFFVKRDPKVANGLWQQAIKSSHKLMNDFPSVPKHKGQYYIASEDYSEFLLQPERKPHALSKVDALIKSDPAMHTLRAHVIAQIEDPDQRRELLSESIKQYPTEDEYLFTHAKILKAQGDLESALADFNRLIAIDADHREAYRKRGDVLFELGQYEQAIDDFTTSISRKIHNYVYAYKRRASAYFQLGEYKQALADLNDAIDIQPDDLSALTWISPARIAACPDRAFRDGMIELADRAVELNDGSAASREKRAMLLIELGQFERAREDLPKVENVDADGYYGAYQAALIALKLDDPNRYQDLCQRFVDAVDETDEAIAMHFAAWTAALVPDALIDYAPALKLAQQAVDAEPDNQQYINGLGAVQFRAGQYAKTLENFSAAAGSSESSNTSSAYTAYFRAMTEHRLDRKDDAKASLAQANDLADQELNDAANPPVWNRKLTLQLLRSEVESMIQSSTSPEDPISPDD